MQEVRKMQECKALRSVICARNATRSAIPQQQRVCNERLCIWCSHVVCLVNGVARRVVCSVQVVTRQVVSCVSTTGCAPGAGFGNDRL